MTKLFTFFQKQLRKSCSQDYRSTVTGLYHQLIRTFPSPIYTFPWWETQLLSRQVKEQIGKSTCIIRNQRGNVNFGGK